LVKLVRLALLTLDPMPKEMGLPELAFGAVSVSSFATNPAPGSPPAILLAGTVPLEGRPAVDAERMIMVPQKEREQAEIALRVLANHLAAAHHARRTLSASMPYVAFEPESADERAWLDATNGIRRTQSMSVGSALRIPFDEETLRALTDRLIGVEFLAEALSQRSASGQFREYVRLFESAFGTGKMRRLKKPLAEFLGGNNQRFTLPEVTDWLDDKRHGGTHARGSRGGVMLESDFAPVIGRIEQAAFDVLLNKLEWGTTSVARRNVWRPQAGALGTEGDIFIVQGAEANINMTVTDAGGLPIHFQGFLTLPEKWWSRQSPEIRFSGRTHIFPRE